MISLLSYLPQAPEKWQLELCPKPIKHIYFRILAEKQIIKVSLPLQADKTLLQHAFLSKSKWILNQIEKAQARRQAAPEQKTFQQGDICYLRGKPYQLILARKTGKSRVFKNSDQKIIFQINPKSTTAAKQKAITRFFRDTLMSDIQTLSRIWQPKIGVAANEFRIRKMKTRWGSCNIRAKRIWINQSLVHLDPKFLSYVLVHELIHLIERYHNKRFYGLMDQYIPDWKAFKKELNHVAM